MRRVEGGATITPAAPIPITEVVNSFMGANPGADWWQVLITDDGHWSYNIITPIKKCEKVYRVGLRKPIAEDAEKQFAAGVQLPGELQLTRPAKLDIITPQEVLLTITEGKFHQVKRMFSAIGNKVVFLHREKIGSIRLDVNEGQWRYLTEEEVNSFSK